MTGVRNNGSSVSLVVLAIMVCYFAIERHFQRSPLEAIVANDESRISAAESEDFFVPPPEFGAIQNGEIRSHLIHEDNPQCFMPKPRNFDPEIFQQIVRIDPGFHNLILQIGNPPTAVPTPADTFQVDPQHDENEDDETANAAVRNVIERELSHTTREERDIWFDELKTLPAGVVRDLLQVRKQLRALPRIMGGIPEKLASVDEVPVPHQSKIAAEPVSQKIRFHLPDDHSATAAIETAISQLRHNLMNAATPGFKRLRVTLVDSYSPGSLETISPEALSPRSLPGESIHGEGCRVAPLQLDLKQGSLKSTGRQLDLAIEGEGFFLVRHGDKELLTRCGALTLNRDRQLGFAVADSSVLLLPVIRIPEDMREIQISADGTVNVLKSRDATLTVIGRVNLARVASPARLQPVGQSLFMANEDSGPIIFGPAMSEGLGEIQQGVLEQSNVDFQAELAEIEELTMIVNALPFPHARPVTASGPQPTPAR